MFVLESNFLSLSLSLGTKGSSWPKATAIESTFSLGDDDEDDDDLVDFAFRRLGFNFVVGTLEVTLASEADIDLEGSEGCLDNLSIEVEEPVLLSIEVEEPVLSLEFDFGNTGAAADSKSGGLSDICWDFIAVEGCLEECLEDDFILWWSALYSPLGITTLG